MTGRSARSAYERDLWAALEDIALPTGGSRPALVSVDRRGSPFTSSAQLQEVDVTYADGTSLALMYKQLGPRGVLPAARRAKPGFVHDPAREILVYRELLGHHGLGTPRYAGSVVEPPLGRYWLFLERVPGMQLRWATDPASWDRTAEWLARAHSALHADVGRDELPLLAYDRTYYLRWLARTRRFSAKAGRSDRDALDRIASGYHRAVDHLVSLPPTVVHGQFYPSNVLVEEASTTGRICVVDWEVAGSGPAALDLAALTAGAPAGRREAMVEAYFAAMAPSRASLDRSHLDLSLSHARLALAVQWLGWAAGWSAPPEQAHDWLAEALDLADAIA